MSTVECDIVVVGLGAMGSATLDQLSVRGIDVVGIDQFAPPHDRGSSHGSSRITREALGEGPVFVQFVRASHRRWRELENETAEELFEQCGAVMIDNVHKGDSPHWDGGFIKTTFETAKKYSIKHEKLDRQGVVSRYPQFSGMNEDDIAYYEPGAGYVRPEKCIETQLKHAKSKGARIYTGEAVTSIQNTKYSVTVSTSSLVVTAKKAIVSAGAWIPYLLGEKFKRLFTVSRQVQFWVALEEGHQFPEGSPVYIWEDGSGESGSFYGFPPLAGENTIKVGSEKHNSTHPDEVDRIVTDEEAQEILDTHLKGRLTGISDNVVKSYACLLTFTPDKSFILDYHPEMQNVFVVAACSGHGFKHSAGVGQAVAQKITGEESEFDLSPFRFDRFA